MKSKSRSNSGEIEIILAEQTPPDLVRSINALCATYRKEYYLSDVYLNNGKGKVVFTKKANIGEVA